jgi:TonB family protein
MTHDTKRRLSLLDLRAVGMAFAGLFISIMITASVNARRTDQTFSGNVARSSGAGTAGQQSEISTKEIEELPAVNVSVQDSGAPVAIGDATIRVVARKPFQVEGQASTKKKTDSDAAAVIQDIVIAPRIKLVNKSGQVLTGVVVNVRNDESRFENDIRRVGLNLKPGQSMVDDLGGLLSLPGDPSRVSVRIQAARFEDGSEWGRFAAAPLPAKPDSKDSHLPNSSPGRTIQPLGPEGYPPAEPILLPNGPAVAMPNGRTMASSSPQSFDVGERAVALPRGWSAVPHFSGPELSGGRNLASTPRGTIKPDAPPDDQIASSPAKERTTVYRYGGGSLHNRAIRQVAPASHDAALKGIVVVEVLVDEQGYVLSARVVSGCPFRIETSDNPALLNAALEAARKWTFVPATYDQGLPVRMIGELFFRF